MTREALQELLDDMSLAEKIGQMNQVTGSFFMGESVATGPMADKGFTEENIDQAGSVIGISGAATVKKIQKEYMEKHPHQIPLLFMLDVINGYRTVFPIPLGQGAAFEPELSMRCARMAAREAAVSGLHVTFSPMADLVRDARWGRVMESTGEDPYLNSLYTVAMVRGYQGDDLRKAGSVAACVKHFAGYGAPDAGRDYNTVELSEHTLRQFYLPAYEAGVRAGAALVMTAFNTIDGIPATGNRRLMRQILRDEMGFDGVLISDWAAIEEMLCHGYCADRAQAARRAVTAGVDMDMMAGVYAEQLAALVQGGEVPKTLIDEAVMRILTLKNALGLFEAPFKDADEEKEKEIILCKEHRALAREAARKSFVLLKNEGVLPLAPGTRTAYIGPYVDSRNLMGAWSLTGETKDVATLREAVLEQRADTDAVFCRGCSMTDQDMKLEGFLECMDEMVSAEEQQRMMDEAVAAAKACSQVVMLLGEDRRQSGEAASSAVIQIPQIQQELLDRVCAVCDQVSVVLFSGRPLDIRRIADRAQAVLLAWMPGTEGARALVDVLSGRYAPSGKLPMSFPYCAGQVPVHYNEYATGRPHVPGKDKDRFRSKYLDIPNRPLYPFGFGMTYTSFSISPVHLDKDHMTKDEILTASVTIRNTGCVEGTETLQLYIHDVAASVVRPVKELKGFSKVTLQPDEQKDVSFFITEKELRFLTENGRWESEPGAFEVFVGTSSLADMPARFVYG
ncbi:MAG: beta-glucosidase BglX [Lachnospiraceae bacterium]|nr:beta-glucosidase BglX [Lachnospiraceae bacterium]MDE6942685.1 beta-glucosidase BglX [Lachnospiraceae bacterium]MDE6989426.1 beta-glucosidase BglX [Lachnospiraceae bacterium]